MPPPLPPYDRAVALPCRMSIFRDRWLYWRCPCGRLGNYPVRQMLMDDSGAGARTLAETVVRARCQACGARPSEIFLVADGRGPVVSGAPAGWSILLHEAVDASGDSPVIPKV